MKNEYNLPARVLRSHTHELAHIRATLDVLFHVVLDDLAKRQSVDRDTFIKTLKAKRDEKSLKFFEHYMEEFGFDKDA